MDDQKLLRAYRGQQLVCRRTLPLAEIAYNKNNDKNKSNDNTGKSLLNLCLQLDPGAAMSRVVANAMAERASNCNPQEISNTVWAYAKLRELPNGMHVFTCPFTICQEYNTGLSSVF